jgi:hypothetical protein
MAAAADALSFILAGAVAADLGGWLLPAAATAGAVTVMLIRWCRQRGRRG